MNMETSQKGASSSVDPKKKSSMLDEEIGNEFLNSWKSISVTEDDIMDFSFDTVSKGKNKAFDFGKLDMDFNLGGSFEKLSSFKVDMPDLDFSCLPKSSEKSRNGSGEESAKGNHQRKEDGFNFSFDFNKLVGFDLDQSLGEGGSPSNRMLDSKAVASPLRERQGSKIHIAEETNDIVTNKPSSTEIVASSKVETLVEGKSVLVSENADGAAQESRTSSETKSEKNHEISCSPEKEMFMPTQREKEMPITTEKVYDPLIQSESRKDSHKDTCSDVQTEVCSLGIDVNKGSRPRHNIGKTKVAGENHGESVEQNRSSASNLSVSKSNYSERSKLISDTLTEKVDNTITAKDDLDHEEYTTIGVSMNILNDIKDTGDNRNTSPLRLLAPLSRGSAIDKATPNDKETGFIGSKISTISDLSGPQLNLSSSNRTNYLSFGNKTIDASGEQKGIDGNNANIGSELPSTPISGARRLTEHESLKPGCGKTSRNGGSICVNNEGFPSDTMPNGCKVGGESMVHDKVVNVECVLVGIEKKSFEDLSALSTKVSPHSSTEKPISQRVYLNPQMEPVRNLKEISAQGNKICSIKTSVKMPDLSSLKILRPLGGNKNLPNSRDQKKISLGSAEKSIEVKQRNATLGIGNHVGNTEKQNPEVPTLKRKTAEASNADLVPLRPPKRLFALPSDSRIVKEPSEKDVADQVGSKTNTALHEHLTSRHEFHQELNVMELEMPLAMENDENVEKAEAYTKELEDICNMLRKKHNEAKEILVRAIVNNNHLLMLNHPMFEEKIRKIQRFATQLLSKELQTQT